MTSVSQLRREFERLKVSGRRPGCGVLAIDPFSTSDLELSRDTLEAGCIAVPSTVSEDDWDAAVILQHKFLLRDALMRHGVGTICQRCGYQIPAGMAMCIMCGSPVAIDEPEPEEVKVSHEPPELAQLADPEPTKPRRSRVVIPLAYR